VHYRSHAESGRVHTATLLTADIPLRPGAKITIPRIDIIEEQKL